MGGDGSDTEDTNTFTVTIQKNYKHEFDAVEAHGRSVVSVHELHIKGGDLIVDASDDSSIELTGGGIIDRLTGTLKSGSQLDVTGITVACENIQVEGRSSITGLPHNIRKCYEQKNNTNSH